MSMKWKMKRKLILAPLATQGVCMPDTVAMSVDQRTKNQSESDGYMIKSGDLRRKSAQIVSGPRSRSRLRISWSYFCTDFQICQANLAN